jgi:hypothetical protein
MIRTQIQLTEEQSKRLKAAAARKGVSVAELIRQGIDASLAREAAPLREELAARAIRAAGRFHSAKHDVARKHDGYLGEAFSR